MATRTQGIFSPADYCFRWTADWYEWNSTEAHKMARRARDTKVKRLRADGLAVKCFSLRDQLVSRGGIGSDQPHIELVVTAYGYNVL